jgi:hypothetical protein
MVEGRKKPLIRAWAVESRDAAARERKVEDRIMDGCLEV